MSEETRKTVGTYLMLSAQLLSACATACAKFKSDDDKKKGEEQPPKQEEPVKKEIDVPVEEENIP